MIEIGKKNSLKALRIKSAGMYLGDDEGNDVLLPNKFVSKDLYVDDEIEVFVYKDSEDRIVATTQIPKIELNSFAFLKVNQVNNTGAFLDWGLDKDLLVPYGHQTVKMEEGKSYVVCLLLDPASDRLYATSKLNKLLKNDELNVSEEDEVDLLIYDETDLGLKTIINLQYLGLLFKSDIFKPCKIGDQTKGFIKKIREDNKIDVSLQKQGYISIEPHADKILELLKSKNGILRLTDKSDPEIIKDQLHMSKKSFKKAVGFLYKRKLIEIKEESIVLK